MLMSLKTNKAPDLYNVQLENYLYASEETTMFMVDLINEILRDPSLFAHTAISKSLASMLYKGKQKPLDAIGSYRRIQICSFSQKLLQKVIAGPAAKMTEHSMVPTQWGFSKGISFLTATFVRETLSKMALETNKNIFLVASDIESAFSRTERQLQLYELCTQGESGKILLFSRAFYTNTNSKTFHF